MFELSSESAHTGACTRVALRVAPSGYVSREIKSSSMLSVILDGDRERCTQLQLSLPAGMLVQVCAVVNVWADRCANDKRATLTNEAAKSKHC